MKTNTKTLLSKRNRRGAAVVEFAVCVPLIVLIVFGSIQAASMLFLRQAVVQASYEGAKVAIRDDSTNAEVQDAIDQVTAGRRMTGVRLTTSPSSVANAEPGDIIQITVSVPGDENSLFPFGPFKNKVVSADAFMVKE